LSSYLIRNNPNTIHGSLDWSAVLSCARSIAEGDIEGSLEGVDKKAQRGLFLLQFLDKNILRLIEGEKDKVPQPQTSSFFSIRSLFGEKATPASAVKVPIEVYLLELKKLSWIPGQFFRDVSRDKQSSLFSCLC
jgi:hypothetical protein